MAYAFYGLGASGLILPSNPMNPNTMVWTQIDTAARASIVPSPAQWGFTPCVPPRVRITLNGPSGTAAAVQTTAEFLERAVLNGLMVVAAPTSKTTGQRELLVTQPCDPFVQAIKNTKPPASMAGVVDSIGWWWSLRPRDWSMPT